MLLKLIPACVLLAASGCAGHVPAPAQSGDATAQQGTHERDVISQLELSEPSLRALSVLDVVRSLRPHFLNERGKNSHTDAEAGRVHVSIDNGRIMSLEELEHIHAATVMEIRYLSIASAMAQFGGAAHEGPVILVRLLK